MPFLQPVIVNRFNPISVFIWRLWRLYKWIYRFLTGKCEIQRICEGVEDITRRTVSVVHSLRISKHKKLRVFTDYNYFSDENDCQPDNVIQVIVKTKNISSDKDSNLVLLLQPCILSLVGVNVLKYDVVKLKSEQFSSEHIEHEKLLTKLWVLLVPQTELKGRYGNHWGNIGFQGKDPATDFRGMGMLGLHCLVYFAEMHTNKARQVLGHSQHPSKGYPLAITSINITSIVYDLLMYGILDYYLYQSFQDRIVTLPDFMEAYCYVMYSFNQYWLESNPTNIMDFPNIKEQFVNELRSRLTERPLVIKLCLN